MKKITILFMVSVLIAASLALNACRDTTAAHLGITSGGWAQVGSQVSPAGAGSEDPTMLVIGQTPAVGYRHESSGTYLNVWTGTDWGTPETDPTGNATNGSMYGTPDFCSDGTDIYMAYSQIKEPLPGTEAYYDRIFVYKWHLGSGWVAQNSGYEVSIPWNKVDGGADAREPAIACTATLPVVSWVEDDVTGLDSDVDAWVATVDPIVLNTVRSTANSRVASAQTSTWTADVRTTGITTDPSGNVYLAQWERNDSDPDRTDLYVTKFDGSFTATALGGAIAADYDSSSLSPPSLVFMGSDLYVAYAATSSYGSRRIGIQRYHSNNHYWSFVGQSLSVLPNSADLSNPDLLVASGALLIAWEESDQSGGSFIYVAYWDGLEWVVIGDQLNIDVSNTAHDPTLAYSSSADYLYVAFEENTDGSSHIFVKRKAFPY